MNRKSHDLENISELIGTSNVLKVLKIGRAIQAGPIREIQKHYELLLIRTVRANRAIFLFIIKYTKLVLQERRINVFYSMFSFKKCRFRQVDNIEYASPVLDGLTKYLEGVLQYKSKTSAWM